MAILVDTNILVRAREPQHAEHDFCKRSLVGPSTGKDERVICAQNVIEFWVVATRPQNVNGLGLTPADADLEITGILKAFRCLSEPADIISPWRNLVRTNSISGRPAHDARLVAMMDFHHIDRVLTLNTNDFVRFPHINALTPRQILGII